MLELQKLAGITIICWVCKSLLVYMSLPRKYESLLGSLEFAGTQEKNATYTTSTQHTKDAPKIQNKHPKYKIFFEK